MLFVWDERKRSANLLKHGLDFADLEGGYDFSAATYIATRPSRTGRSRFKSVGKLQGRPVVVIFSPLGAEALAIVSLRPASPGETS